MKSSRKLTLRTERLAELTATDMQGVAGATRAETCETWFCHSNLVVCRSLDDPCPTLPLRPCLSLVGDPCIHTS